MSYNSPLYLYERCRFQTRSLDQYNSPLPNKYLNNINIKSNSGLADKISELELSSVDDFKKLFAEKEFTFENETWYIFFIESYKNSTIDFTIDLKQLDGREIFYLTPFRPLIQNALSTLSKNLSAVDWTIDLDINSIIRITSDKLIRDLYRQSIKTIILEYNIALVENKITGENDCEKFISFFYLFKEQDYFDSFFNEYSVLKRILSETCIDWIYRVSNLFIRLNQDLPEISKSFFNTQLKNINLTVYEEAGDKHNNSETVCILGLNEFRLVYKPKDLKHQSAFNEFVNFFAIKLNLTDLKTSKIITKPHHAWCEYIENEEAIDLNDINTYYYRLGVFQCILYFLNGYDIHFENIIACKNSPVIVDIECLFFPKNPLKKTSALSGSILESSLLPSKIVMNGLEFNLGASENIENQQSLGKVPFISKSTDKIGIRYTKEQIKNTKNLPFIKDVKYEIFPFLNFFKTGFQDCFKIFLHQKDAILSLSQTLFTDVTCRILLRNTFTYAHLLQESYHPDYLRSGIDRELLFEHLRNCPSSYAAKKFIKYEHESLLSNQIPCFTFNVSRKELLAKNNTVAISNFFDKTGLEIVQGKIIESSEISLQLQLWLMDKIIEENSPLQSPCKLNLKEDGIVNSSTIADVIAREAFDIPSKMIWLTKEPSNGALKELDYNFYQGTLGISFFYTYLYKLTNSKDHKKFALKTLNIDSLLTECTLDSDIGLFTGTSGMLYTLAHMYSIFKDKNMLQTAKQVSETILTKINATSEFDILKGISGSIMAYKSLLAVDYANESTYKDAINYLGLELIRRATSAEGYICWNSNILNVPLGGFSHGTSGIAVALAFAYDVTKNKIFYDYISHAMNYEKTLFKEEAKNWIDMRFRNSTNNLNKEVFQYSWCNGSAGIGLSRINLLILNNSRYINDLDIAIKSILNNGFGDNHCLCHGDVGSLDFLLTSALNLKDESLINNVNELSQKVIVEMNINGITTGKKDQNINIGFMTGLSGIAYQLIRMKNPQLVPSVLLLDVPN